MSANALIVLGGPVSGTLRRGFAHALIRQLARATARLIVATLEHRLRRQTYLMLSELDDRILADIGLHRRELNSVIHARTAGQARPHDPMR